MRVSAERIALKLRATRPAAQGKMGDIPSPPGRNAPVLLERSPPGSFKRLLDSASGSRSFLEKFVDPSQQVIVLLLVGFDLDVFGPEDEASLVRIEFVAVAL